MTYQGCHSYQTLLGASFTIVAKVSIFIFSVILIIGMIADNSVNDFQKYESPFDTSKQIEAFAPFAATIDKMNANFELAFGMYDYSNL